MSLNFVIPPPNPNCLSINTTLNRSILLFLILFLPFFVGSTKGQNAFGCEGQIYTLSATSQAFDQLVIDPSNSSVRLNPFQNGSYSDWDILGFRSTDNLLYAIDSETHILFRIDADGNAENIDTIGLDANLDYLAGDITPNGNHFVIIGSSEGKDEQIVQIDLNTPNLSTQTIGITGLRHLVDITFDPLANNVAFGYDTIGRRITSIDLVNLGFRALIPLGPPNEIEGIYFDAFGQLFGYGTTAFGEASSLFKINKATGQEVGVATGPASIHKVTEMAACPYTVAIHHDLNPKFAIPCDELLYTFYISNQSNILVAGVDFELNLPDGLMLTEVVNNTYNGNQQADINGSTFNVGNMLIPKGIDSIILKVEVMNTPPGNYKSQALLKDLPSSLGENRVSDNPRTVVFDDASVLEVRAAIEEDSLFQSHFFCLGESIDLDGSPYGSNLFWDDGSNLAQRTVTEEGIYTVESRNRCNSFIVAFDVTAASCPFTVALAHEIIPSETLPCTELTYKYVFQNDAGVSLENISFEEVLPEGFTFIELLGDPFGGELDQNLLNQNTIKIDNMALPLGFDTLSFLVEVGNIPPGDYPQRAVLEGFPQKIGPRRFSFDPNVPGSDSTNLTILGVEKDSLQIDLELCANSDLSLNGQPYGVNFEWFNGSTEASVMVNQAGLYELVVFDGCSPRHVFFSVADAPLLELGFESLVTDIRLGDSLVLVPNIRSEGDTLTFLWRESNENNTLNCYNCETPLASPLENSRYQLVVGNGNCTDSINLILFVDKTRRIYSSNIFSPNQDGINDFFYLQSPDFGVVESFTIVNRWGTAVFNTQNSELNEARSGWDGRFDGQFVEDGIYIWQAEITFLDGVTEVLSGDVMVLR